jgi:uncharacterized membrane protein
MLSIKASAERWKMTKAEALGYGIALLAGMFWFALLLIFIALRDISNAAHKIGKLLEQNFLSRKHSG